MTQLTMKVHEEKREKKLLTDQMKHMKEAFGELQKVNLGLEGDRKSNEEKLLSMNSEHKKLEDQNKKYAKDLEKMEKDRERDRKKLAEYNQQSNDLRSQVEACEEEKFHRESFINRMREELKDREIRLSLLRVSILRYDI
jgi:chromosome segregation ATPase